ncbi:MAG: sensor domain-containing diguanylate cyclase [Methylotenera sp.]|uniref:sensor domain-containing diguanylate cyclase n=1 Tax=Methylotenera sp. TaxID=2051956 RepID=UPI0024882ABA|nr:sensor domain-containing diguanylate cyclase [Methylotenera sp.]MDI1309976.1 sensor domain-containing diguanylate cyclase [Methylotenera sp.]
MNFSQTFPLNIALFFMLLLLIAVGIFYIKLKNSEELWKFALEGAGDGVWDWDIDNDKAHFSDRYKEMLGFSSEEINDSINEWNTRVHPDDAASLDQAIKDYLSGKAEKYIHEHRMICKDKSIMWVMSRGMIVKRDKNGKPMRMVGTHTDITARKLLETRLENLAHFDALANIPNRTLFNDRLKLALSYTKREKKMLAVMFIDLDLFKEINDLYGHETGDIVLKKISRQLVSCVRESDTVARMGGDEFVVLLPIVDDIEDVKLVASKIVEAVAQPIKVAKTHLHVTCSIGIAIYPQHGKDEKLLMINADMAMYQAKNSGKNQAKFFEESMLN